MVIRVKAIFCILLLSISFALSAQVNEVTLVASGDGPTESDAVNNALRSAIEQAYGVFVSANTDILNDELVKDEIVTVSSGNIHSYKKLGIVSLPNGNKSVSVEATVSVSKLIKFAESKGASCEFAGATFGANLKQIKLNQQNAEKAMQHLYITLMNLGKTIYDYELKVGEPKVEIKKMSQVEAFMYGGNPPSSLDCAKLKFTVIARANDNYTAFTDLVYNTLRSLSIKNVSQLQSIGIEYYPLKVNYQYLKNWRQEKSYTFYSDDIAMFSSCDVFIPKLRDILDLSFFSFVIWDSNGKKYDFYPKEMYAPFLPGTILEIDYAHSKSGGLYPLLCVRDRRANYGGPKPNFFPNLSFRKLELRWARRSGPVIFIPHLPVGEIAVYYEKELSFPVEELSKISGFTIERYMPNSVL